MEKVKCAIVFTKKGLVLKYKVSDVRIAGRGGKGIRAIRLMEDDHVVAVHIIEEEFKG